MPLYIPTSAFRIKATLWLIADRDSLEKEATAGGQRVKSGDLWFAQQSDLDYYQFDLDSLSGEESHSLIAKENSIWLRGIFSYLELEFDAQPVALSGIYKILSATEIAKSNGAYWRIGLRGT